LNASEIHELLLAFTRDASDAREALSAALTITQPHPLTPAFFQGSTKGAVGGLESILSGGVAKVQAYFPPWLSPRRIPIQSPASPTIPLQDINRPWLPPLQSLLQSVLDDLVSTTQPETASSEHDRFMHEGMRNSILERWGCAEAFGIALRVLSSPPSSGLMLVGKNTHLEGFDHPAVHVASLAARAAGCIPVLIHSCHAMSAQQRTAQIIKKALDSHLRGDAVPPTALILSPSSAKDPFTMELLSRLLTWPAEVAASIASADGSDPLVCSYGTSHSAEYVSSMAHILLRSHFKVQLEAAATKRRSGSMTRTGSGLASNLSTPRPDHENDAVGESKFLQSSSSTVRKDQRPSLIGTSADGGALKPALEGHRHGLGFALSRVEAYRADMVKRAGSLAVVARALKERLRIIVVASSASHASQLQSSFPALFQSTSTDSMGWISVNVAADGVDQLCQETTTERISAMLASVAPFVSAVIAVSSANRTSDPATASLVPPIDLSFVNSANNLDASGSAELMLKRARLLLSSVLVTIHEKTSNIFVEKNIIETGSSLPESMIDDLAITLESIHNAQYKALKARRAELASVLSKLSRVKPGTNPKNSSSVGNALETKLEEIEKSLSRFQEKLKEVDGFVQTLAAEVQANEALVDETRSIVNKVSYIICATQQCPSRITLPRRSTWRLTRNLTKPSPAIARPLQS
jgi:hypothetical protein